MKEPMDVPPTKSTGTPASSNAFSTPMCEQPLQQEGNLVTNWESPRPYPPEKSLLPSPQLAKNEVPAPPLWESHQQSKLHLSNTLVTPAGASPTPSPCSAPTQHEGDGVASEHPRQPGEIAVPVCAPGENLLVQLMLGWRERNGP